MKSTLIYAFLALSMIAVSHARDDHKEREEQRKIELKGAVFTMDNAAAGNHVYFFGRQENGSLAGPWVYDSGGKGSGDGLGNQGAVQLSRNGHWLFVCNAGSDEISVFGVSQKGLWLSDRVSSQGRRPISLTLHGNLVYVLNAGGLVGSADNIAGFIFIHGKLIALPNSSRGLSQASTDPAQVAFTRDGNALVVTEKATAIIDVFSLENDGLADGHQMFASPNPPPFGFASGRHNRIYVSEANGGGGNPGGSTVSSYQVTEEGGLEVISQSVPSTQTAACWMVLSKDERFAFSSNTPNDSLSSFRVGKDGGLSLLNPKAAQPAMGSAPVDTAFEKEGKYLYVLNTGNGSIGIYRLKENGDLKPAGSAAGLPAGINGLAAR